MGLSTIDIKKTRPYHKKVTSKSNARRRGRPKNDIIGVVAKGGWHFHIAVFGDNDAKVASFAQEVCESLNKKRHDEKPFRKEKGDQNLERYIRYIINQSTYVRTLYNDRKYKNKSSLLEQVEQIA